jgi:hypothetical protein
LYHVLYVVLYVVLYYFILFAVRYVINLQKAAPVKLSYFSNVSKKKLSGYDNGKYELINL